MKTIKLLTLIIGLSTVIDACNSNESKDVQRPEKSSDEHLTLVKDFDSQVASIMTSMRKHKKTEAIMTEVLEDDFVDLFIEANKAKEHIETISYQLAIEDYKLFERDSRSLKEKEMEFESLRQNK